MPKESPWRKWYPQDWLSDPGLAKCSIAARGLWADAVNYMLLEGTDFISGTEADLSRLFRCTITQLQSAVCELRSNKVAQVSDANSDANDMQNECITLTCRRLRRELSISTIRSESASIRWSKRHANTEQRADARSVSASAYKIKSSKGEGSGERDLALEIYESYPLKVGKPGALKAVRKAIASGADPGFLLERTKAFAAARNGDKQYCPHPATWFNDQRYNDDPSTWVKQDLFNQKPQPKPYKEPWKPNAKPITEAEIMEVLRNSKQTPL